MFMNLTGNILPEGVYECVYVYRKIRKRFFYQTNSKQSTLMINDEF